MKEYLKKVKVLEEAVEFSKNLVKRDPEFYFFNTELARKRAALATPEAEQPMPLIEAHKCAGESEMVLRENLLAIPLRHSRTRDYSGGLITQVSLEFVHEALHMRNEKNQIVYSQELSSDNTENLQIDKLPEINAMVMFAGILHDNFGQFLLESLGRLWAYDRVKHLDPYVFFLLASEPPDYLETRNFAYQVFKGFGIPLRKIIFVHEPTRIKTAIIPSQKYGYGYSLRPSEEFMKFIRRFSYKESTPTGFADAENIYVSRSQLNAGSGRMVGESFFEKYLAENGYLIFHPEKHTISEQLTVYSRASKVLFSDGPAIHACILLPDLTASVAIIAGRRDEECDVSDILNQFKANKQDAVWIDSVIEQYLFGLSGDKCLALLDWVQISYKLISAGFIDKPMERIPERALADSLKNDMRNHIQAISGEPGFIDYMLKNRGPVDN